MNRRHILISLLTIALIPTGIALAHNGDEIIPGFEEASKAGVPILVHVTAPWCEVCQAQKPIVKALLAKPEFKSMKKFDVDFDSQKEVLGRLRVTTQSTMIVFKGDKEIDRQTGQTDPAMIEALLRRAL